ncbi:unnamed protein product, partial [Rotaria sp. Silwood2]
IFCELDYDGCTSGSACKVNWDDETTCIKLNAADQLAQNRSYYCNGSCIKGYNSSVNGYTCDDIDECSLNSSLCGNGTCFNLLGSYGCNCHSGYRFNNETCVDIDECTEPDINGTFARRCSDGELCRNTDGNYSCECSSIFNNNGTCTYNSSLCNSTTSTTCIDNLREIKRSKSIAISTWCEQTCHGFCEPMNGSYKCNCKISPGFEYSDTTKGCLPCRGPNYGYGCNESCRCVNGNCNRNATHENESCNCNLLYAPPFCIQLIDKCATNSVCNNATEDCATNPNNGTAICTCKLGYERNNVTGICTDIDECAMNVSNCNPESSTCNNTIGNYICDCKAGYQLNNVSCIDINECLNLTICVNYDNTYCANVKGLYECRCKHGYSVGGHITQAYQNILNTNDFCQPIDYSSYCENQCLLPATCNAAVGRCACPRSIFDFILSSDAINQTCQCPGHPFVNYISEKCISTNKPTWFLIYYLVRSSMKRLVSIESYLKDAVLNILTQINGLYKTTDIQINNTSRNSELQNNEGELFVGLNISLNATHRLQLVNEILQNTFLNANYNLTVRMIMNEKTGKIETFTEVQPHCKECEYEDRGVCSINSNDTCTCFSDFEGYLCRRLKVAKSTNWIIIVSVISAIAGLLLIISVSMCIFYIIGKRRHSKTKETKQSTDNRQFTIPRAHPPTMGTTSKDSIGFTVLKRITNDGQSNDASDTHSSNSTTTYNPIYRTNEDIQHTSLPSGPIPQTQMLGIADTLNSFPRDLINNPSGTASLFSDSHDIDEIEFVTDMLDDMIKDDDNMEDDFVEAINPNIIIPRSTT